EKLERQYRVLTDNASIGLCFTAATLIDDERRPIGLDPAPSLADYSEALLLRGNIVAGGGGAGLVRAALCQEGGGFDSQMSQCADWDLWLRLSVVTEFASISEPLVLYRYVAGTMSGNPRLLERDTFALLDKFFDASFSDPYRGLCQRAYANHWMICAGTY